MLVKITGSFIRSKLHSPPPRRCPKKVFSEEIKGSGGSGVSRMDLVQAIGI